MMLAEIFLLKLESKLRATSPNEAPRIVSSSPFVRFDIKSATAVRTTPTK
jgi:hypothetical protein